jgi:NAD(P)-dependent dehydrogenase (short-subunit alcohol dehydrogenase family)
VTNEQFDDIRFRGHQGRRDRVHQIAGARDGAPPGQRQLRLPRPDGHAAARRRARTTAPGLEQAIPFRRVAQPDEIADAVVFFASDRACYITGQVLSVSGGLTMAG